MQELQFARVTLHIWILKTVIQINLKLFTRCCMFNDCCILTFFLSVFTKARLCILWMEAVAELRYILFSKATDCLLTTYLMQWFMGKLKASLLYFCITCCKMFWTTEVEKFRKMKKNQTLNKGTKNKVFFCECLPGLQPFIYSIGR